MRLGDKLEEIRKFSAKIKDVAELGAAYAESRKKLVEEAKKLILAGEGTGNQIRDFVFYAFGTENNQHVEGLYHGLEKRLVGKSRQLALIVRNDGKSWVCGVLESENLIFERTADDVQCRLPISQYIDGNLQLGMPKWNGFQNPSLIVATWLVTHVGIDLSVHLRTDEICGSEIFVGTNTVKQWLVEKFKFTRFPLLCERLGIEVPTESVPARA